MKRQRNSIHPPENKPIKLEDIEVYEIDEIEIMLDVEEINLEDVEIEEIPHALPSIKIYPIDTDIIPES